MGGIEELAGAIAPTVSPFFLTLPRTRRVMRISAAEPHRPVWLVSVRSPGNSENSPPESLPPSVIRYEMRETSDRSDFRVVAL